jgi:hypothetical protein
MVWRAEEVKVVDQARVRLMGVAGSERQAPRGFCKRGVSVRSIESGDGNQSSELRSIAFVATTEPATAKQPPRNRPPALARGPKPKSLITSPASSTLISHSTLTHNTGQRRASCRTPSPMTPRAGAGVSASGESNDQSRCRPWQGSGQLRAYSDTARQLLI